MSETTNTPAPPADAATGQGSTTGGNTAGADAPTWNHRELVDLKKDVRNLHALLTQIATPSAPTPPASPAKAPDAKTSDEDRIARLEGALVRQSAKASGLDDAATEIVARLYQAEKPQDVDVWVRETVAKFPRVTPTQAPTGPAPVAGAPATTTTAPLPNVSDRGAPTPPVTGALPPLNRMRPEMYAALSPEERRKVVEEFRAGSGNANPFRSAGRGPSGRPIKR